MTRCGHRVVVNKGNWYYDNDRDDNVYDKKDHVNDLQKKEDGKTETAAAAEAAKAAEVAAVAMVRADNNQQRAAKTVVAAIAVGKRRQARGEKWGWWRGRRQGGGGRWGQWWQQCPVERGQR